MPHPTGLTIRRHERREIDLPVELVITEEHRDQITFSATSGAVEPHIVAARTLDISSGGVGLSSSKFVPRGCRGRLRVFDPNPIGTRSDGSPILEVAFDREVQVRRVALSGHEPTYFIGVSFDEQELDLLRRISLLMQHLDSSSDPALKDESDA